MRLEFEAVHRPWHVLVASTQWHWNGPRGVSVGGHVVRWKLPDL